MAYVRVIYSLPGKKEVEEYHSARYGAPGQKREKKRKPTKEEMEKVNRLNREKRIRRKLEANFSPLDYYITLTYRKEERPADMDACKADYAAFIREVKREYQKQGQPCKWMRNIEVGPRGGWHIHMVVNRVPGADVIIQNAWEKHGGIHLQLIRNDGGCSKLAAYICKTPKTDTAIVESHFSCSRNLVIPKPEKHIYLRWTTWKSFRVPKGYELDEDSVVEGDNPITGYPYRSYTLIELPPARKDE